MKFTLEFLGSGTSVGVPVIGCDCAVCASEDPRNKRLRSSVLVRSYNEKDEVETTVVIDTTPDFRQQMLRSKVQRMDAVIITHYHADHIAGIDDVRRYNHMQNSVLDCWGTRETLALLKHSFGYIFVQDNNLRYGLPCLAQREAVIGDVFQIGRLKFEPIELDHQIIQSTGFKISCGDSAVLSYCLDVKRIPEKSFEALQGTHTLVLDMLREKVHPTHMNLEEAMQAAERINPRQTIFGHIAHEVDHAAMEARLPEKIKLAYDGLVITMN